MKELLDELNEVVYIVALDTYELLYLNSYGLRLFGYENFDEIKNCKCYEIFYKTECPCSFCNADRLSSKTNYEWECKNTLINKYFLIKEKLIEWNGKKAHLVVAKDITKKEEENIALKQTLENERIVLECIKMMHSSVDIDISISNTLEVMGKHLNSSRTYIFELNTEDTLDNTYEWCARGIKAEKNRLQRVPLEDLDRWIKTFKQGLPIVIEDLETLKGVFESEYITLGNQNIHSLVAIPIMENNIFHGFFGVDNPPVEKIKNITDILNILSYFFLEMLQRKNLLEKMQRLSYHDPLTGALNRNAFIRDLEKISQTIKKLGVVFIDVNGLKGVNDHFGHTAGDELIINTFDKIKEAFSNALKYRTGGDEFIVFCRNEDKEMFLEKVADLKEKLKSQNGGIAAIGANWTDNFENIHKSIKQAEINMYKDKENFYNYQAENEENEVIKRHYFQKLDEKN